jgi:hypothetical protein
MCITGGRNGEARIGGNELVEKYGQSVGNRDSQKLADVFGLLLRHIQQLGWLQQVADDAHVRDQILRNVEIVRNEVVDQRSGYAGDDVRVSVQNIAEEGDKRIIGGA